MAASMKRPPVSLTLPIACQICLGKVKEPVVCSNQHVFCNSCMEVWLQHRPHCPTCRVAITADSPCKQILGGMSGNEEDTRQRRSTPELRKMRFEMLHREQELEFEHLKKKIDALRTKNAKLEEQLKKSAEILHESKSAAPSTSACSSASVERGSLALNQIGVEGVKEGSLFLQQSREEKERAEKLELFQKLQTTSIAYERLKVEHEKIKEENAELRNTSAGYLREIGRLKHDLTTRSPRKYEKYALAAQQSKLDKSEQEVKQLKRALERSDVYVEELEEKVERYRDRFGEIPWSPTEGAASSLNGEAKLGCSTVSAAGIEEDWRSTGREKTQRDVCWSDSMLSMLNSERGSTDGTNLGKSSDCSEGEPSAKRFYSSERRFLESACSSVNTAKKTLFQSTRCSSMAGVGKTQLEPGSSGYNATRTYVLKPSESDTSSRKSSVDPGQQPSSSRTSAVTPSSLFKTLRVGSPEGTKQLSGSGQGDVRLTLGSSASPRPTSNRRSPRRQLDFLQEADEPREGQGHPDRGLGSRTPRNDSFVIADAVNDNDGDLGSYDKCNKVGDSDSARGDHADIRESRMFDNRQQASSSRTVEDTANMTLNDLDYSLTPEFVDCAKLLKAAEQRVQGRSENSTS